MEAHVELAERINTQRNTARKISNDISKILSLLLENTFDVLFVYIYRYRMDISNINNNTIKEFIAFTAGLVPIVGSLASGLVAIINVANQRSSISDSADNTMYYLENYLKASEVWSQITDGYTEMLKAWKEELKNQD